MRVDANDLEPGRGDPDRAIAERRLGAGALALTTTEPERAAHAVRARIDLRERAAVRHNPDRASADGDVGRRCRERNRRREPVLRRIDVRDRVVAAVEHPDAAVPDRDATRLLA